MTQVDPHPLAAQLVETATRLGADAADALVAAGTALDVSVRKAETESIERADSLEAGLRVIVGGRQASVAMSDVADDDARTELVERAIAMARVTPEDPHAGLPAAGSRPAGPVPLPLSGPALAALSIFSFLGSWNSFLWPLVVTTSNEMRTIPVGLSAFQGEHNTAWNLLMAGSVIALVPVLAVYMVGQNWFQRGITLSGMGGR